MVVLLYAASFVVLIGILVSIHEFGHYYAARSLGVHATHFSVGMGPLLLSRADRHGTAWQLRLYPVGGYVKFRGDADAASSAPEEGLGERAAAMTDAERRTILRLRSPGDRAFVLAAGPAINVLFGLVLMSTIYVSHGRSVTSPLISQVVPGEPAALAGIRDGDRMVSIDGAPIRRFEDATNLIASHAGVPISMVVTRAQDGSAPRTMTFAVVPRTGTRTSFGVGEKVGLIGIRSVDRVIVQAGPIQGLREGLRDTALIVRGVVSSIVQVATGARSLRDMGGPVKIAEMSGHAAQAGILPYLVLMAALSINVGVFNLFPVPVLDGGQLVMCLIEAATRRPVRERTMLWVNSVGFALLMSLFVTVTVSDVWGLLSQ